VKFKEVTVVEKETNVFLQNGSKQKKKNWPSKPKRTCIQRLSMKVMLPQVYCIPLIMKKEPFKWIL
jgi:hypothetical protein